MHFSYDAARAIVRCFECGGVPIALTPGNSGSLLFFVESVARCDLLWLAHICSDKMVLVVTADGNRKIVLHINT